jgi:flagellar motility protein MotE (MotC chaperone)
MTKTTSIKRSIRTGRGALWVIAGLFLASGLLRLTVGTGPALARGVENFRTGDAATSEPLSCKTDDDISTVLQALNARKQTLDKREAAMADRMAALDLADQEIGRKLADLESAESKLSATLSLTDNAAEGDLARLTAVYENMKAKEAAALFEEMAPDFAAGFLGRMRPDAAAAVMAGLSPQSAYTISVVLAGRNANVPTE